MSPLLVVGLKRPVQKRAFEASVVGNYRLIRYNGSKLLKHIDGDHYSAIVLDWDLSRVPACQVVARAKSQGVASVVLCASPVTAFGAGEPYADVYLEKPVDPQELREIVLTLATTSQQAEPSEPPIVKSAAAG